MPPTYLYECPTHGEFELVQRITEPAYTVHGYFNIGPFMEPPQPQRVGYCKQKIKRLISGGCGFVMDSDRLYDTLPRQPDGKVREAKTDLKKDEAYLIGVPRGERDHYRKLHHKGH